MDISKLKPWNWLKKEEEEQPQSLPAGRGSAEYRGPLANFHEEVDRLFDDAFHRFGMPSILRRDIWPHWTELQAPTLMRPNIDVSAGKNEYVVTAEVPGVEEKDVTLDLCNNTLTI